MTIRVLVHVAAFFLPMLRGADLPGVRALTQREFDALATRCAPGARVSTLRAIARVESAFNPLAVSINYPNKAGAELGLGQRSVQLARQPGDLTEAIGWSRWLLSHGQTVSVGLMQLNSENFLALNLSLEQAFEPCANVRIGWLLFSTKFEQARRVFGPGSTAMRATLSSYNAGSWTTGYANGYVERVMGGERVEPAVGLLPPARLGPGGDSAYATDSFGKKETNPNEAPTKVRWEGQH